MFAQFLDCVHQLLQQFPFEFEFNLEFLSELLDQVYDCKALTFLGDCDRERDLARPALPRLSVKSRCSSNVLSQAPRGMVFLRSGEFVPDLLKLDTDLDRW